MCSLLPVRQGTICAYLRYCLFSRGSARRGPEFVLVTYAETLGTSLLFSMRQRFNHLFMGAQSKRLLAPPAQELAAAAANGFLGNRTVISLTEGLRTASSFGSRYLLTNYAEKLTTTFKGKLSASVS